MDLVALKDTRSLAARLFEFSRERFLPIPQVLLILLLTFSCALIGNAAGGGAAAGTGAAAGAATATEVAIRSWQLPFALQLVLATLAVIAYFFRLRVFDDVKDAAHDAVHETSRPIPRGLVTPREVNALSVAILVVEAALVSPFGKTVFLAWAIAAAYTLLMRLEFFCGDWLEERVLAYAATHVASWMPYVVFATMLGAVLGGVEPPPVQSSTTVLVAIAVYALGMGFEMGRKHERYFGAHPFVARAIWSLGSAMAALLIGVAIRGDSVNADVTSVLLFGASVVFAAVGIIAVRKATLPDALREAFPALLGLVMLVALPISLTLEVS